MMVLSVASSPAMALGDQCDQCLVQSGQLIPLIQPLEAFSGWKFHGLRNDCDQCLVECGQLIPLIQSKETLRSGQRIITSRRINRIVKLLELQLRLESLETFGSDEFHSYFLRPLILRFVAFAGLAALMMGRNLGCGA